MNTSNDLEAKRKRIELVVKILGLCAVAFLFEPIMIHVVSGLAGLAVTGLLGTSIVWFTPVVGAQLANWRLKALKAVAAANPIETLENQYQERQTALLAIRDNIKQSYAVLEDLRNAIKEHDEQFPGRPSQNLEKYNKLKSLIELRGKKYKQAQVNLAQFSEVIKEKTSDWKIAQTMAKASKLANVGQDFQSKLMADTALTTVQDGLNLAFSELETSLLDEQSSAPVAATVTLEPARVPAQLSAPSPLDLGFDENHVLDGQSEPESVLVHSKKRQ